MPAAFSVVVPLYNKRAHVADALASALGQRHAPSEVIVVDDASTDGSRAVVEQIADPRVRLIGRMTPGPGGYAARNLGIEEARGDWIAFLDADDRWSPDHLSRMAAAIRAHPDIGCVATRYDHVFSASRRPSKVGAQLGASLGAPLDFRRFLVAWLDARECPIWTSAAAFRRDVLIEAGLFPAGRARRGGDKDLWLRAMRLTRMVYDPRVSAEFHRDSENKVSKSVSNADLPIIVGTARAMLADAAPAERKLLRRLINQEIGHYARYQFKTDRIGAENLKHLCMPEGLGVWARVTAMRAIPSGVRQRLYAARQRATTGGGALEHA